MSSDDHLDDPAPAGGDARLEAVAELARRCGYEREHTRQVTRLALVLFDELRGLHGYGPWERFLLRCGATLHDIGWIEGQKGHHKTARRLILEAEDLPFTERERQIVALIARYHRKALPKAKHPGWADLDAADRRRVRVLAGLLRVADGLDRSHLSGVRHLRCETACGEVVVRCDADGPLEAELAAADKKADLLRKALGRPVTVGLEARGGT
jgi:exopolyphosphatase/guanosine-5'-triphosphate,3'-diphosphate pyrophosphatase